MSRTYNWASVVLFVLALIPRLSAMWQGFITPDEPIWVYRAFRFAQALEAQRWADTLQIGHPGVVTMWMGALGIWWQRWRDASGAAAHLGWVDRVAWVTPDNGALFRHLAPFLPPARLAMALMTSLGVVGVYLLARRLWDRRLALAGAVLVALDPFVISLSGLLHVDAPAMTFTLLSLLAWLNALSRGTRFLPETTYPVRVSFALLSGLCAGLGILSKSPSLFVVAAVGASAILFVVLVPPLSWRRLGRIAILGAAWVAGAVGGVFTLPAMWIDPMGVIRAVYGLADRHLDVPHRVTFFRGTSGGDPGPWFYPTVFLFRLTPIVLVGLVLALFPLLSGGRSPEASRRRAILVALWLYAIGFTAFITVGAKKFDRYLLPAFPALDLLAAVGWIEAVRRLQARLSPRAGAPRVGQMSTQAFAIVLVILAVAQGAMILPGWPYYLGAYNPLVGGLGAALRTLPVGWGEGTERVAEYVRHQPLPTSPEASPSQQIIATGSPVTLSPLVDSEVLILGESSRLLADRLLITATDRQIYPERVANLISGSDLAYAVRVAGQQVLWLYDMNYRAEADHLVRYGAPGDVILCDAPSPFARHAPEGSVQLVTDADEAEIAALLNQWSAEHARLWYLAYPSHTDHPVASPITASILRHQLEAHAARLDHVDLGYVTATLYILPEEPRFAVDEAPRGRGGGAFQAARFGGQLAVVGGALLEQPVPADGDIRFRVRWRALTAPQADYAPFIHLIDGAGHMRKAGRGEELLVDERYWPTSYWSPGDGVELDYLLGLPTGTPPGQYQIVFGLADAQGGGWLPVLDEQGRIAGSTAPVLSVDVGPAAELPAPDALHLAHPTTITWQGQLRLLGYEHPPRAQVGQRVIVEVGWLGLDAFDAPRDAGNYGLRLSLVSASGEIAVQRTLPLSGYPTSRWRAGEVILELYDLVLPAELEDGEYTLQIEVLDGEGYLLASPAGGGHPLGTIAVSEQARLFELPRPPQYPLQVRLGQEVALLGYDLPQSAVLAGDEVSLTLYWRCQETMETSYTVFVHLLDADGQVQGQRDRIPAHGRAPTSGWVEGQIVVDEYMIPLPEGAWQGEYRIEVGMYNAKDMVRLAAFDAQGNRLPEDRILLDTEIVLGPERGE